MLKWNKLYKLMKIKSFVIKKIAVVEKVSVYCLQLSIYI